MRVLLVDNYDSFTYNLYQLIGEVCEAPPTVIRNDTPWAEIRFDEFDAVVGPRQFLELVRKRRDGQ